MQADQDDFEEPDLDSDFEYEESSKKKKKGRAAAPSKTPAKVYFIFLNLKERKNNLCKKLNFPFYSDTKWARTEKADPDELRRHGYGEAIFL